jgi:hypothetical protein
MALTRYGTKQCGGGVETALAATTAIVIGESIKRCDENVTRRFTCSAVSDVVIRLNYLISPDNGTTWVVAEQKACSTVTVDGGTASYVNSATLDRPIGYLFKVEVYNTTGGAGKVVFEYREYST